MITNLLSNTQRMFK